jgi:hypothetical protein
MRHVAQVQGSSNLVRNHAMRSGFVLMVCLLSVLLLVTGCAGPSKPSWIPCASCKYQSDPNKTPHDPHPYVYCIIDGREVDCRKNPPECPECARKLREREGSERQP